MGSDGCHAQLADYLHLKDYLHLGPVKKCGPTGLFCVMYKKKKRRETS